MSECTACKGKGRIEKYYAGLRVDGEKIIQLPQCPDCKGWIQP